MGESGRYECDRCKYVQTRADREFAYRPAGWWSIVTGGHSKLLCPRCHVAWETLQEQWFNEVDR